MAAREREAQGAQRREVLTEVVAAAVFALIAGAFWVTAGMPSPGVSGWWLTLLCAVFVRVGFDIGEGHSRPVVLAVVPMLLLAPAASVPLLVVAAHCVACVPDLVRGRMRALRVPMLFGDAWFVLAPALLFALAPDAVGAGAQTLLIAAALVLQSVTDLVASGLRLSDRARRRPARRPAGVRLDLLRRLPARPDRAARGLGGRRVPRLTRRAAAARRPAGAVRARAAWTDGERGGAAAAGRGEPRPAAVDRPARVGPDPDP